MFEHFYLKIRKDKSEIGVDVDNFVMMISPNSRARKGREGRRGSMRNLRKLLQPNN